MSIKDAIAVLGVPGSVAVVLLTIFAVLQICGEFIELSGKVVPEFFKIRKIFTRRKREREEQTRLLAEVQRLLQNVDSHYNSDNITLRDNWMNDVNNTMEWVHTQATCYDNSIQEIKDTLTQAAQELQSNTKMTQKLFIENSRDRIIDFAEKVSDPLRPVSREEFNRIFKVYNAYEEFLAEHELTNGEVDIAYRVIQESYQQHLMDKTFTENLRNYN